MCNWSEKKYSVLSMSSQVISPKFLTGDMIVNPPPLWYTLDTKFRGWVLLWEWWLLWVVGFTARWWWVFFYVWVLLCLSVFLGRHYTLVREKKLWWNLRYLGSNWDLTLILVTWLILPSCHQNPPAKSISYSQIEVLEYKKKNSLY